jgi:predicted amidophosphoribosyltransferase
MSDPTDADNAKRERETVAFRVLGNECSACRQELRADWQFCAHCEARLATACPACGVALPPAGANHCGHCGLILLTPTEHGSPP